jgi:hypothetical protein
MIVPGSANALLLASAGAPAGYQIERSLRFNSSDSAYLSRTPASAGNRKTWTWSGWVKRSSLGAAYKMLFSAGTVGTECSIRFTDSPADGLEFYQYTGSGFDWRLATTQLFRDVSAWYHIVASVDSTQATASERAKLYVNGVQVTAFGTASYPTSSFDSLVNSTVEHGIGRVSASQYFDGYLADVHLIDGQALTPSSFAETNITTGQWVPKAYTGTYGTNGFRLAFADNSNNTATTLGKDSSPNGNNWTPNNLSVTAGAGNDSLVDTPTSYGVDAGNGGEVRGNYCTLNPLSATAFGPGTFSDGNLQLVTVGAAGNNYSPTRGTFSVLSGKWYWEVSPLNSTAVLFGIGDVSEALPIVPGDSPKSYAYQSDGTKRNNSSTSSYGASYTTNDVIGVALDLDAGTLAFYKNGASQGNAFTSLSGTFTPFISDITSTGSATIVVNFGQRPFAYTAPSGFKALCDTNLPAPVVAKPNTAFDVALWTGNGSARSITGLNFNPDFVWIKGRSGATDHALYDVVRGTEKRLESNTTDAEVTSDGGVTAFNSDGFSLGTLAQVNTNSSTYVGWAWDGGTSTVTNTQGSITSQVRANASAGFSIVSYASGAVGQKTVGHGLNVAPSFIITKSRTSATFNWVVYHASVTDTTSKYLRLNTTDAVLTFSTVWGAALPTSTVFGLTSDGAVVANTDCIAYCFAPVAGYSSFGSYTGNGSADGPFIYTGFRSRWVLIKKSSSTSSWYILDTARDLYNQSGLYLYPDLSNAEDDQRSVYPWDILSNGFKPRAASGSVINDNGATYIYAAFAENPFQYARAR